MDKYWPLSDNQVKMQRFSKSCLLHLPNRLNRPLIVGGTVDGEYSIPSQQRSGYWWNIGASITIWRGRHVVNTTHLMGCHQLFTVFCQCNFWWYWCLGTYTFLLQKIQSTRTTRIVSEGPREWQKDAAYTHNVYEHLGTLLKAHLGTGADYQSKIETKKSSLNANPKKIRVLFKPG